ncbi:MAG: PAS domain S-box protein, partial [Desulfobacterota bacterium]|nr:PAS domain S-box protein [Thermodesulfobacteriota bacterium]
MKEENLPAAMAVRGEEGVVEGVDYRGVSVIAALRRIPDSPWFLVAKVDKEEIYGPIYRSAKTIAFLVSFLIAGSAVFLGFFWFRQQSRFFERQYEAEKNHRAMLERYGYLTKYANDIILLIDQDLNIVEANERALSAYGYSLEELLKLNAKDLRPPELRSDLEGRFQQVDELNGAVFETIHQRKDGTVFPVSCALETERVSIWFYNEDYSQIRCFDLYEQSKKSHTDGEILQASEFPEYTAYHQMGQVIAAEDVFKDPRTSSIPHTYFRHSGIRSLLDAPVWVQGKLVGLLGFEHVGDKRKWLPEEEQIAMTLAAYVSNCLEANERRRTEELLIESEKKYRLLIENAGEAIFVVQEGRLKFINSKTMEMTGYSREELTSKPFMEIIHPEDRPLVMERHLQRLQGEPIPSLIPFRILHRSGDILWAELNTALIEWEGKPATLNFVTDITERKKSEQEIATLQEQLRQAQKMEAIGRLAGGIAHDFNNILTVIKGSCQLSLLGVDEKDPLYHHLQEIDKAADRAGELTRQLLAFSRKQVLAPKVLELNGIVKNLEKMLRRVLGEDIELVTFLGEGIGRVKADPGQMEQVIINLAVNARDAMPRGGKLTIETANAELDEEYARRHIGVQPGSYVLLSISDTGIGMT